MSQPVAEIVLEKLRGLHTELVDLAFTLEHQGQITAADVAISTSIRVRDLCGELSVAPRD